MRDRGHVYLFVIVPVPGTSKFKIRCLPNVPPIFNRRAWQIVGVEGREIDCRCIVGGVHKRCAAACNGISNADLMPHEEMGLKDVRALARTTIMGRFARRVTPQIAPQEVAVA